ncbi:MAG TPA: VTT domain-containing protein [Candidatus Paceibacterota bacterium]
MFLSPTHALAILEHYHYWLIFPIAVIEGPIIIIISGFLVSLGFLNTYIAFAVLVLADTIGDSLYYLLGRYWRRAEWVKKIALFLGFNEDKEKSLENHFKKHKIKTFLLAKISHGIGGSVQVAGGYAGVDYLEFLALTLLGTIPKTFVLMIVGFYLGNSYMTIDSFLDYIGFIVFSIFVFLILYLVLGKYVKSYFAKGE